MTSPEVCQGTAVVELTVPILRTYLVGVLASLPTEVLDPTLMLNSVEV